MLASMHLRYIHTSDTTVSVTWKCLKNLVWIATGSETGLTVLKALRLKRVRLWAPPVVSHQYSDYNIQEVALVLYEGLDALAQKKTLTDSTVGLTPAHIDYRFPTRAGTIGMWHDMTYAYAASDTAFAVAAPKGTLLDLELTVRLPVGASSGAALTASGATAGTLYINYLDNTTTAGVAGGLHWTPENWMGSIALGYG